jgi:hypothetical protein
VFVFDDEDGGGHAGMLHRVCVEPGQRSVAGKRLVVR